MYADVFPEIVVHVPEMHKFVAATCSELYKRMNSEAFQRRIDGTLRSITDYSLPNVRRLPRNIIAMHLWTDSTKKVFSEEALVVLGKFICWKDLMKRKGLQDSKYMTTFPFNYTPTTPEGRQRKDQEDPPLAFRNSYRLSSKLVSGKSMLRKDLSDSFVSDELLLTHKDKVNWSDKMGDFWIKTSTIIKALEDVNEIEVDVWTYRTERIIVACPNTNFTMSCWYPAHIKHPNMR